MSNKYEIINMKIGAIIAISIAGSGASIANDNPFELTDIKHSSAITVAANDVTNKRHRISVSEGKCGEGKCGSLMVRVAMDANGNEIISRKEYIDWVTKREGSVFDKIDTNRNGDISRVELSNYPFWLPWLG